MVLPAGRSFLPRTATTSRTARPNRPRIYANNVSYFSFASVLNTDKWLAVRGGQDADGAALMTYDKAEAPHFQFKLKLPNY